MVVIVLEMSVEHPDHPFRAGVRPGVRHRLQQLRAQRPDGVQRRLLRAEAHLHRLGREDGAVYRAWELG